MSYRINHNLYRTLDLVTPATRVWGILTVIVYWGIGADLTFHRYDLGIYIIISAVLLTVLETAFAVDLFLDVCIREERGLCLRLWRGIRWIDLWRKSVLYAAVSFLCFWYPVNVWLAILAGVMTLVLCVLYLILTYKNHLEVKDALLADKEDSYDRFDELQDDVDDTLPEPDLDNVGDQDRILQV
ncbi:uncharacterized protein LOC135368535 [Ornithodoros turicata]|uniref:Putative conserved plasma membrane protein n=1 Tax=Ornithodoros turicata TaxID=34597 RepID=A0A2R5LDK4_9ACAR